MKREMICVSCPIGCALSVELDGDGKVLSVSGNTCKRGEKYAITMGDVLISNVCDTGVDIVATNEI